MASLHREARQSVLQGRLRNALPISQPRVEIFKNHTIHLLTKHSIEENQSFSINLDIKRVS